VLTSSWRPPNSRDNATFATVAYWNIAGAMLLGATAGWLGGELVDRMAVGVDDGAHLNSPSSLSGLPAYQREAGVPTERRRAS
jgi:hypothetical protein